MASTTELDDTRTARRAPFFRRVWMALAVLVMLLLMALIPPYVNVNRYQRRITTSISASLGRPVHLDHVTLNLLPVPGFTLDNFVVSEDPAFGAEPTIRAQTVRATLRVSTLWRRRIEFATISLTDPSINLVHTARGAWNLDSILLQAAHLAAAPTAQREAGPEARFPYIEATGARLNLKMDDVKTPFSLTEADFALWLPSPETWHFRITAKPTRTDVQVGYTGALRLEGTLGRAPTLGQIPIDLRGEWRGAPLGEMSRIVLGRDGGWRGEMTLNATAVGTLAKNDFRARLKANGVRRADFVPDQMLSLTAACEATVGNTFHTLDAARCGIPAEDDAEHGGLTLSGSLADIRQHGPASVKGEIAPMPVSALVGPLQTVSTRISPRLTLGGILSGNLMYQVAASGAGRLEGMLMLKGGTVMAHPEDKNPVVIGDMVFRPAGTEAGHPAGRRLAESSGPDNENALMMLPTTFGLGARDPATMEGRFDRRGYTLRLTGSATAERLTALRTALPQFGDGLAEALPVSVAPGPIRLDLIAMRAWGGSQTWMAAPHVTATGRPRRHRRTGHGKAHGG